MVTRLPMVVALVLLASVSLQAQIPRTISYQGILLGSEGSPIQDGPHTLQVDFYTSVSGGTPIYSETHSAQTSGGLFSIVLGEVGGISTKLSFNVPYWIGISVDGGGELVPRTPMTASPYALNAIRAESLSPDATGIVRTMNGADGAVTLQGGGGTTITRNGSIITISSTGGSGGTGIQGVQNSDGSISIVDPNGPTATVGVARGGITNDKLADGSVTVAKLGDGSVTTAKLGDGSVTTAKLGDGSVTTAKLGDGSVMPIKINTNGAGPGEVLKFNGKSLGWASDDGLALPFADTASSTSLLFYVANSGTGGAGHFSMIGGSTRSQDALTATHNGDGDAFYALSTGTGRAGYFQINDTGSHATTLQVTTNGYGAGLVLNSAKTPPVGTAGAVYDLAIFQHANTNVARINGSGKGFFNGGTQSSGADVAEAFDVVGEPTAYTPGDVLVIATSGDRTVEKSSKPYSVLVAGVYATKPGVLLTEENIDADLGDKVPMGVVGVIPTKVCNEGGAIRRGDLLVTSSRPGYAMKANPDKVKIGMALGKALENFNGSGGIINVLVSVK